MRGELTPGADSVATRIMDVEGRVVAALSVVVRSGSVSLTAAVPSVVTSGLGISRRLGWNPTVGVRDGNTSSSSASRSRGSAPVPQILVNGYVAVHYPASSRATALGWSLGIGRIGAILGPILGGLVAGTALGYQWNFYVFAVFALLGAVLIAIVPAGAPSAPPVRRRSMSGRVSPPPPPGRSR